MALRVGDAVRIFGLVSEEGRKINGCEATVLLPGDRCHVKLKSGVKKSVRESNLVATGEYDSDDGWNVTCVAKRPRLPGSGGGSLATTSTPAAAVQRGYSTSQVFLALTRRFPLVGRHPEIVDALRELERYEIACQGDDHADREFQRCNSEALEYARAAAVVCGLEWSLGEEIGRSGRAGAVALLEKEPYIGKFRAGQIVDLFQTGTCAALTAFRSGDAPISSKGVRRFENEARRSMRHAPEKRALNRVVGISHMCAIDLAGGTHRSLDKLRRETGAAPRHVRSVEELRRWPGLVQRLPRSTALAHSLSVHDELQEPVPLAEALEMRSAVEAAARRASKSGSDCPPPREGEPLCSCCWHAEFVGGGRTRGKAGHDVDILLWHHKEPASWGDGKEECLLLPLVEELQQQRRMLRREEAFFHLVRTAHRAKGAGKPPAEAACGGAGAAGEEGGGEAPDDRRHRRDHSMLDSIRYGIENLACDHHDKVFAIWRSAGGRHRRIDVVVCAFPEELPFARLAWTGSRMLNRMMRLQAIALGINLGPHAITARNEAGRGSTTTRLTIDAAAGTVVELRPLQVLPFKYVRSEEDILRIIAGGTNAFAALVDPVLRNA
mmetsp:Transcript_38953/g.125101  ORF Transcript_38953/g.125101 Transcript_38953/m.125101 type:complete len:609 (+) Transcript_38953:16-1842(+)